MNEYNVCFHGMQNVSFIPEISPSVSILFKLVNTENHSQELVLVHFRQSID